METKVAATKQETETKTQGDGEQKAQFRHQEYTLETGVYPQEPECMKELRDILAEHPWNIITASADEGQFSNPLLKPTNAENVYTGYSLRKILAMDINGESYELGLPVIQKAGVAHKIEFREGPAIPVLYPMIELKKFHGLFDLKFANEDKDNNIDYHKPLIEPEKVGGVIGYDNTLCSGSAVAPPDAPPRKYVRNFRDFMLELDAPLRKYGSYFRGLVLEPRKYVRYVRDFVLEPDAPLRKYVRYFTDFVLELNRALAAVSMALTAASMIMRMFGFQEY